MSQDVSNGAPPRGLALRLCGTFAATDSAGAEIAGLSRRGQGLLAYLSQQGGMRAERGHLADLMWSDRGEDQARASLRQELSLLRRHLPKGVLDANRQHVWLNADRVACDTSGAGGFLQGFDLPSEAFEDWLRATRSAMDTAQDAAEPAAAPRFAERPAVLLFAFEALSAGTDDAMIAAGLTDDLRTTLSYWRWFPVIGPDAIGWKTAKEADMRAVAAEVQVAYCVSGTLRCQGNRVRIAVGLTEAATGRSLWSHNFDGTLDDIFAFQEEVSRAIVAQLEPQISRAEAMRIARVRPSTLGPWQLLAQADEIDRTGGEGYGSPKSNFEQVRLMETALEQDPAFAPALSRLARVYFRAALLGWLDDRDATYARSLDCSTRALQIDPDNWEAHAYLCVARAFALRDYGGAAFHGSEAVRLNPSAALARMAAGCGLEWNGRPDEALEHLHFIFRLNPRFTGRAAALGDITTCEMFLGNAAAALDAAERLQAIAPDYARGLQRCVATFGYFGATGKAEVALQRLRQLQPDFDEAYVRDTYPYARERDLDALLTGLRNAGAFSA